MGASTGGKVRGGLPWARGLREAGWAALSLTSFVGIWWLISLAANNSVILPSPPAVVEELGDIAQGGELASNLAATLRRLALGYLIGATLGITLGVLMASTPVVNDMLGVSVEFLRPIPAIALIPLGLFLFGIGEKLPVSLIAYSTFFPFLLNTMTGVRQVPRVLLQGARTLGATRWMLWQDVLIPGALPSIFVGARVAMGLAWMTVVAAELVGGSSGLGFMIMQAATYTNTSRIFAGMVVIAILSLATIRLIQWLNYRACPWAPEQSRR